MLKKCFVLMFTFVRSLRKKKSLRHNFMYNLTVLLNVAYSVEYERQELDGKLMI